MKIPLVGLTQAAHNGSCYMRLFEQRAKPSFSDKGIKCFACMCVCVCGTEAVPHKDSPAARQVEAGKEDEGVPK